MSDYLFDVLIVGGGCAGVSSAVAASRNGAKVLLIEENGFLGGNLTAAGVNPISSFYSGETKVIGGFVDEMMRELKNAGYKCEFINSSYPKSLAYSNEGLKYVFEKMCVENNVELLYHTKFINCKKDGNKITECLVLSRDGYHTIKAKYFIDASGDASLAYDAGIDFVYGGENGEAVQTMSTLAKIANVDDEKIDQYIKENPSEGVCVNDKRIVYGLSKQIQEAKQKGYLSYYPRNGINAFETSNKGEYTINMSIVNIEDAFDPFQFTKAEIEGRKQVQDMVAFLKEYAPGFKDSYLTYSSSSIGVRETRKIIGAYKITEEDLINNVMFDDAICMGAYPVDLHDPKTGIIQRRKLKDNSWYSIPYRCLYSEKIDNLIVTGRCLSSTQNANSAIRVSAILMSISQAAGTAIALANKNNIKVSEINIKQLQEILVKDGAFLKKYEEENL